MKVYREFLGTISRNVINVIILVVTITGKGDNPTYIYDILVLDSISKYQ